MCLKNEESKLAINRLLHLITAIKQGGSLLNWNNDNQILQWLLKMYSICANRFLATVLTAVDRLGGDCLVTVDGTYWQSKAERHDCQTFWSAKDYSLVLFRCFDPFSCEYLWVFFSRKFEWHKEKQLSAYWIYQNDILVCAWLGWSGCSLSWHELFESWYLLLRRWKDLTWKWCLCLSL